MPPAEKGTPHDDAEMLTLWCLERAFKIAVANVGLTDWGSASEKQKDRVYTVEAEIAKMLFQYVEKRV